VDLNLNEIEARTMNRVLSAKNFLCQNDAQFSYECGDTPTLSDVVFFFPLGAFDLEDLFFMLVSSLDDVLLLLSTSLFFNG
jgi:hypothetical protein